MSTFIAKFAFFFFLQFIIIIKNENKLEEIKRDKVIYINTKNKSIKENIKKN